MDTDATDFLAHSEWVGELARELVRDAHDAEDLAQSARLAALERPPDARASLRGWFATVLRNLRRSESRSAARRAHREASVARELASEPHDSVFERFETQRMVSAAVAQLDEPYRTAILLRYFEGLAPREIARRTCVPVRTVHTHLARGLGRLRSTLDRGHDGDRSRWFAAVAPLARGAKSNSVVLEVMYVKSNVKLVAAVAAIALLVGAGFYGSRPASPREIATAASQGPANVERVDPHASAAPGERLEARSEVASAPHELQFALPVPAVPAFTHPYRGRVLTVDGAPLAGVRVECRSFTGEHYADSSSDTRGWFEIAGPDGGCKFACVDERYVMVLEPVVFESSDVDVCIVVAESIHLAGVVVDSSGAPVGDVELILRPDEHWRAGLDCVTSLSSTVAHATKTDELGRFEFARAPRIAKSVFAVASDACRAHAPVPLVDTLGMRLELCDAAQLGQIVRGRVVDENGAAIADAIVGFGGRAVQTDAEGRFALRVAQSCTDRTLLAAGPHRRVVRVPCDDANAARAPMEIVLRDPALAITGRVVRADGTPLAGAAIGADDPTFLGALRSGSGDHAWDEAILAEDVSCERNRVITEGDGRTDADGRFEIAGLDARNYRLRVLDGPSTTDFTSAPIEAGSRDVEVALPPAAPAVRYAGRVVSFGGKPLAGAMLSFTRAEVGGERTSNESTAIGGPIVSADRDGRFSVEVPGGATHVRVARQLLRVDVEIELAPIGDPLQLKLVVPLRCPARIESVPPGLAVTAIRMLDAGGRRLALEVRRGDMAFADEMLALTDGRSEPFDVTEDAATLVYLRGETEVGRRDIALDPERLNELR